MATQAKQQGIVRVHQEDHVITIQVLGWGNMNQSMPVRKLAEQMLAGGGATLRVDLRHCTYIDSTFLGTLLHMRRLSHRDNCELVLVSPSAQCCRILQQMGVEECLPSVVAEELEESAWTELPSEADSVETFNRNVIEAHRELANLDSDAGKSMRSVAQCLSKDDPPS